MDSSAYVAQGAATNAPQRGSRRSRGSRVSHRVRLNPLWPIGIPLPPPLPITPAPEQPQVQMGEPATIVGDSGKAYARVNDRADGLPEQIAVSPPAGAPPDAGDGKGRGVSMAGGGAFNVGDWYNNATGGGSGGSSTNPWDEQEMLRLRAQMREQQQGIFGNQAQQIAGSGQYLDAQGRQIDAQGRVLDARGGVNMAQRGMIPLNRNVLMAEQGVIGARDQQINAQGNVISAQETELGGSRGLISLQQQQLAERNAGVARIRNAGANVADKAAVAMESLYRGTEDALIYNKLGVAPPPTISVQGADPAGVPPGMRAELKTQEQLVSEQEQMKQEDRASTLEGARLAVQLLGTNTEQARLAAARVGLTVDQAQQMVARARNTASMGELGVDEARLNASDAELASSRVGLEGDRVSLANKRIGLQGDTLELGLNQTKQQLADMKSNLEDAGLELYTDPYTGRREALTPAEADQRRYDYETSLSRQRIPTQYETSKKRADYEGSLRPLANFTQPMFQDAIESQLAGNPMPGLTATEIINELASRPGATMAGAQYQYGLMAQEAVRKANLKKANEGANARPPVVVPTD